MKDKKFFTIAMAIVLALALFMIFRTNTQSFKRLSASVTPEEEKNIIIEKSKQYISDNIDKFDGESIILLGDLINKNYLTEEEKEDVTNDLYDENTRIFFTVKDSKIVDIYLKNELFSKLFKCSDVCYINENNYIYYNNDVYQIVKVDSNGSVYITNNEIKSINTKDINNIIKNKYNELDKEIANTIDLISQNDINNSNIINPEKDMLVTSPAGYKIYSINNQTRDIDVIFIIRLLNTINYKLGDGTKFNPYVITK